MIRALFLWIRIIIALALLSVLGAFALSNEQVVQLRIWPTDYVLDIALSVAILVACAVAFLIGAGLLWFSAAAARGRLRRSERTRRDLEEQLRALNARMVQSSAARPMSSSAPIVQVPAIAGPARSGGELTVTR